MTESKSITIQFLGAAGTVTGSKHLIRANGRNILVDCGLFQGLKKLRLLNRAQFPIDPASIDVVLLTHGHLDHVGYLPRLVTGGYKGKIIGTDPTLDIAKIILEDSAKIQEEDADRANEKGYSRHKKALPLYTLKDVSTTVTHFQEAELETDIKLFDGITIRFRYNGHILGATFIEMNIGEKRIVFSGDIGRETDFLLRAPDKPDRAEVLLIEATYGNRLHPAHPEIALTKAISEAAERGGTIIIPSFAVERTQSLMYLFWQLKKNKSIPDIPVYMDSPMGKNILDVFLHHSAWHKLTPTECTEMCSQIKSVHAIEETYALCKDKSPKIIIAGSGMIAGGRVLTYLLKYLPMETTTVMLVGFQAEGTRGRQLLEGASEIKIFGKYVPVKAHIENLQGFSAHADQRELLNWINLIKKTPAHVFLVHAEPQSADCFRVKLKDTNGWDSYIPELNETIEI